MFPLKILSLDSFLVVQLKYIKFTTKLFSKVLIGRINKSKIGLLFIFKFAIIAIVNKIIKDVYKKY